MGQPSHPRREGRVLEYRSPEYHHYLEKKKMIILATERWFTLILWSETNPRSFFLKVQKGSDPLDIVNNLSTCCQRGGQKIQYDYFLPERHSEEPIIERHLPPEPAHRVITHLGLQLTLQGLQAHWVVAHLIEDVVERGLQNKARWMMTLLAEAGNLGCKKNDLDLPHIISSIGR